MSYSFMALYLPMNFPCVYVIDKWGLRIAIIGGIASTALGLWVRTFLNYSFYMALIGNIIMALGQPLLYNAPALVTTNWFPQHERPMATMVGTQMNIFGIFIGFLLPSIFLDSYSEGQVLTDAMKDNYKQQMFNMMTFSASFALIIMIFVIISFRECPGVPLFSTKQDLITQGPE